MHTPRYVLLCFAGGSGAVGACPAPSPSLDASAAWGRSACAVSGAPGGIFRLHGPVEALVGSEPCTVVRFAVDNGAFRRHRSPTRWKPVGLSLPVLRSAWPLVSAATCSAWPVQLPVPWPSSSIGTSGGWLAACAPVMEVSLGGSFPAGTVPATSPLSVAPSLC